MAEDVVGEVVGPVSASVSSGGAERYARTGAQYDCAIGGMPFVMAISDERPYARETADFKKQQVDQSNSVGDQSLTGYWTRGQSSFHRGAGIRFYEILEGDTITNRYADSRDVDVWTAGEVSLKRAVDNTYATAVVDAVQHNGAVLILTDAGLARSVTYAGVPTTKASSDAAAFSSIASDGTNVYATNAGKIERLVPAGSFSVLWTHHVGGRTWSKVFWAKDRLWAVDNTGEWYTLSTVGGVTAGSDVLWTSGKSGVSWSLADGQGGVFIATANTIFFSSLDTSTTTPTLIVPISVGTVGAQETIATIGAYLGYLVVTSDAGVRMGQIQSGGVVLGNLIIEANFSKCTRMAYRKSLVQVAGLVGTDELLYEVNVLEQVTDLQGAYSPTRTLGTSSATPHGSLVLADGRTVGFSSSGLRVETTEPADSGYVTTGYHRFGTLEPKDFRTLTVRAEGGGTIAVEKVLRDGTVTSLLTLGVANFYDNEISLNLNGPTDFIALRFTLAPDVDGNEPTLLGYQLRALPAPIRQRLIQIPLQCFDVEKIGRNEHGHKGWAWERLTELEALEESSQVIQYQDFTIGETSNVSVERVQFQRRIPTRNGNEGFGGFIVLTLRKVT